MPRGIDHLVLAVRDLDAAGAFYERLGFLVSGRNRHPWGTENRIVQFPGSFLELITVGPGAEIPPHLGASFSFGAFVRDSLERREGLAMLVLDSADAAGDKAAFDGSGIGGFETFAFSRLGTRPDGSTVQVAFTLAFARDRLAPAAGFFVCQQHFPENFWNPAFQQHGNGATGVSDVFMLAENPADHAEFLSAFTGQRELTATSAGVTATTPRGQVHVLSTPAFAFRTGVEQPGDPARLVGYAIAVSDLQTMAQRLDAAGIPFARVQTGLVIGPDAAFGTTLLFVAPPGT